MSKRNSKVAVALAGLFAFSLLGPALFPDASQVYGQEVRKGRPSVKYVFTVDYPVDGKEKYIAWVTSIAEALKAPPEVRSLTSYDNYYGASPHRVIEFEFDNLEDAGKYFANEKISAILADWTRYGLNGRVHVLVLRSDYTPK